MEPGEEVSFFGVSDGFDDIRIEERFPSVGEIDVKSKRGGLIDNFSIKAKIHVALIFLLELFVRTHDALEVAVAGELYPQPHWEEGQFGELLPEMVEESGQTPPVG